MTITTDFTITPFQRRHLQQVDDLIFHHHQLHTHMDWYDPLEWLEQPDIPVRLAWRGQRLVGVLAASLPVNGASWLRLAALRRQSPAQQIFASLWYDLAGTLLEIGTEQVHILISRPWIKHHIEDAGFRFVEDVITLQRSGSYVPAASSGITIQVAQAADLPAIADIDEAAFDPPWQMTVAELRQAWQIAAICTIARQDKHVVGYQISTIYSGDAHLARLAVTPQHQNQGIGAQIIDDLLGRLAKRHIFTTTVNTQISNLRSQRLYRRFGFCRNGYDLPVWSMTLRR